MLPWHAEWKIADTRLRHRPFMMLTERIAQRDLKLVMRNIFPQFSSRLLDRELLCFVALHHAVHLLEKFPEPGMFVGRGDGVRKRPHSHRGKSSQCQQTPQAGLRRMHVDGPDP